LERPLGKVRSKKQWNAYQKLVAYYNHQKTVNQLADSIEIGPGFTIGGVTTINGKKPGEIMKRDSTLELLAV